MDDKPSRTGGARVLLVMASVVIVVAGLRAAASIFLPFLMAVFLALVSLPLLNWLQRWKVPTPLAVLLTVLAEVLVVAGIFALVGGSIGAFTEAAPRYQARLTAMGEGLVSWLNARGVRLSPDLAGEILSAGTALDLVTRTMRAVTAVLSNFVLVLLTVVFILLEAAEFPAKFRAAFGHGGAQFHRFTKVKREVQSYLGIKTLTSLVTGVLIWLALTLMQVDFAVLWGLLAFLLNYIPNLGSIVAAIPPILLALVQYGPWWALAVAAVFLAVNLVLGNLVEPLLMGRRLGLSTLVIFLSLVFWGWVWGPVGMILSVPLTMVGKIALENTEDFRWLAVLLDSGTPSPPPADSA